MPKCISAAGSTQYARRRSQVSCSEWYEHGKRYRKAVADFATVAEAARLKAIEVEALKAGAMWRPAHPTPITPAAAPDGSHGPIPREGRGPAQSPNLHQLPLYPKKLLVPSYEKKSVDLVAREDILAFMTRCYELGLGRRTVYDKLVVVPQLFKRHGKSRLIASSDWPKYIETIRPIYEHEEIQSMLNHAIGDEAIFLKIYAGLWISRSGGATWCWGDLDFRHSQIRVTLKALWKRGNPNSENDMIVKCAAHRAKLNCGQRVTKHGNKCAEGPYCRVHPHLQKFALSGGCGHSSAIKRHRKRTGFTMVSILAAISSAGIRLGV